MERKKTGRPSKGPRASVTFYLPLDFKAAAFKAAGERGMSFTDFVGELISKEIDVPYRLQEGLPLNKAS